MTRLIWIPWRNDDAEEFLDRSTQWNEVSSKHFTIVTYDPGTVSTDLRDMDSGSIYMRGHGLPGSPFITTTGKSLHITHSIDRLIEMGLQPGFSGKIKFYSCYSAVDSVVKMRSETVTVPKMKLGPFKVGAKFVEREVDKGIFEGSRDCLARRGAAHFRSKGFRRCTFHGYPGPLSGKMEQKTEDELANGHYHKHCLVIHFDEVGTAVSHRGIESVGRRASQDRVDTF